MFKVKFADIGEGLTEGKVAEVLVKLGQTVKAGDPLFFVETDKVNSEIPAPVDGKIANILIKPDQEIVVGEVVMEIDDGSSTTPTPTAKVEAAPVKEEENASVVGATPVSNKLITRGGVNMPTQTKNEEIKATPLVRRMALDLGIDLATVTPTGPGGKILSEDLKRAAAQPNQASQAAIVQPVQQVGKSVDQPTPPPLPAFDDALTFETKPMNPIRKATVKAMKISHTQNAAFTGFKDMDITNLVETRNQLKDVAAKQGIKLTYLAFIVKAAARALKDFPNINVRIDEENNAIRYMNNINIGIAVDTPDGLMVPVIKSADKLSLFQIAQAITDLADKARHKKLTIKEMTEATFTITNFGSVGLTYATAIINPPEAAIMGVGAMSKQPVYINGEFKPRDVMPFIATVDHRIIDGADAGRFLMKVEEYLQNPILLLVG
ncbi:dihydrolipoamide acetyltransferase family protein [Williamsoniiplasma lucivorax]|uniref:Dihydrolipoamide acetyltransferase component of pyruvate dehydrogenase complex n=1 Tax=Williamsoniiplasma lucivorax TaxID=209274 RepID=A0A2S5RAA2_9MOLU|nr:dihydrolipoamide acetyltransferase family protein [Williamsoniiplasma lucivorax]PPE04122.1 pyruvate dehydrogenase E2 component (dihydrolipoamide acetyltransferase) [Williamsoniiplasma lucivorax]